MTADGISALVVTKETRLGKFHVGIDLPVTAVFEILPFVDLKTDDILGRISQEDTDFVGKFPTFLKPQTQMTQQFRKGSMFGIAGISQDESVTAVGKLPFQSVFTVYQNETA